MRLRKNDQGTEQKQGLEEQYERMFPKIARDFVVKEDLDELLLQLLIALQTLNGGMPLPLNLRLGNARAMSKAVQYKDVIETGKDGTKLFVDLIQIDEGE